MQLLDESRRLNSIKNRSSPSSYNYYNYNKSNKVSKKDTSYSNDIEMSMQTNSNKTIRKIDKSNKKQNNSNNNKICNYYYLKGHLESNCYKKYPNLKPINKGKSINNIEEINTKENILSTFFSNNKLNSFNNNNNKAIEFILDSSATIYVSYNKELFNNIKPSSTSIK